MTDGGDTRTIIHRNFVQRSTTSMESSATVWCPLRRATAGMRRRCENVWQTWMTEAMLLDMARACASPEVLQFVRDKMAGMMGNVDYFLLRSAMCLKPDYMPDDTAVLKTRFITPSSTCWTCSTQGRWLCPLPRRAWAEGAIQAVENASKFDDVDLVLFVGCWPTTIVWLISRR